MRVPHDRILRAGRRLVRWWLSELGAIVPAAIRDRLSRHKDLLVLTLSDGDAIFTRHLSGNERIIGRTALSAAREPVDTEIATALGDADLKRCMRRGTLQICVRLPAKSALTTHITLPAAVEENLRQVMEFELDRRTPFSVSDVHFAHRIVERDAATDQIRIELTVVARPVVAEAIQAAQRFGLTPTIVDVANGEHGGGSGNLLPEDDIRIVRRPGLLLRRAAYAALLALAVVTLYRPAFVARQKLTDLTRQVRDAQRVAGEVVRLRDERTQLDDYERYLVDYRRSIPTVSEILDRLTRTLPDNTWLAQLTLTGDELHLSGFSTSASSLLQPVGQSSFFIEPHFRSAVIFDPSTSRERFEMVMTIVKRGPL